MYRYMNVFIAASLVSLLISLLALLADLQARFPPLAAYFTVALVAGCATGAWANRTLSGTSAAKGKAGAVKETGSVKWFNPSKGFGFITRDNGEEIFVHFRAIMGRGHRVLREGERVEFAVVKSSKGLQADQVSTINKHR